MVRETGLDQHGPETDEFCCSSSAVEEVGGECAGVAPGVKAEIAVLASTCIDADTEDEETEDGDDFDAGKVELDFAVD